MTETMQFTPSELADQVCQLAAVHGLADGALGGLLLSLVERLEAPFAIKEMAGGRYVYANLRMAALVGRSGVCNVSVRTEDGRPIAEFQGFSRSLGGPVIGESG